MTILTRLRALFAPARRARPVNPRSEAAKKGHRTRRAPVLARMNQIRAELGLPPINHEGA